MKTTTSPIAGLTMALLFGTALTLPINVAAEIQPVDKAPSDTVLLPYFEVDTSKKGTLFDTNNKNGVDKAAPQTPKPPQGEAVDMQGQHKKNKKNKKKHHDDDHDQGRLSGKKHGNKNSEGATNTNDNVLWGDYYQTPSTTANPTPKVIKSTGKAKQSTNPAQWSKTAGDAQGRYSVDFDATKSPTSTSHPSKLTNNGSVASNNDERPNKHQKKHNSKHHQRGDDQNQGND